ncbi:MAG: iron-containing alcohol dehydrogenase [Planctomycetes bacterium]|nr:iron-containing alcohol dehydrogenase [Planctomycetota bacterium]
MAFKKFGMNTQVLIGENVCEQISMHAEKLGARNILVVTDEGLVKAGIADKVLQHIDKDKFQVKVFSEVQPDPSVKVSDKGAEIAKQMKCDLIIAVGGGSSIDAGKAMALVATNGGSAADYEGIEQHTKTPLPLFAIPTTCGTGSEVTGAIVMTNTDTDYKFIIWGLDICPKVAFLDPTFVAGIPKKVMVPTAMDALTHCVESYLSKLATPQSQAMSIAGIKLLGENFVKAANNTSDLDAMLNMLIAADMGGIALASTRLGIVHAMALPPGAMFHVPHGIANAILLPHGLEYNLGSDDAAYCEMAKALGCDLTGLSEAEGAKELVKALKQVVIDVDAPAKFSEVGVTEDKIEAMAKDAMKSSHISVNPKPITEEAVIKLYKQAM